MYLFVHKRLFVYQLDSSHWFRDVVDLSNPANDSEKGRVVHLHHRTHLQPGAKLRPLLSDWWRREVVESVGGAGLVWGRGLGLVGRGRRRLQGRFGCRERGRFQSGFRGGGGRRLEGLSGRQQHGRLDERPVRGVFAGRWRLKGGFIWDGQRWQFRTGYCQRRPFGSRFCSTKHMTHIFK